MTETLLTAHADFVRTRAPQVGYSARILYQELRASRGYTGSYETVKWCVAPLSDVQLQAVNIRGHSYRLKEKLKAGLVRVEEASPTT